MMMTVQDVRDYVRNVLEVDDEELMDMLLDVWLAEAQGHIQASFEPFVFYQVAISLTTSSQVNAFADIVHTNGAPIQSIDVVEGDQYALKPLPHASAIKRWAYGDNNSGKPTHWSEFADSLYLWPSPEESGDYTIHGQRDAVVAVEAADELDLPEPFHPLVAEFVLARGYEFEDDDIMSQIKFNRCEQSIDLLRRRYKRAHVPGIQVLGGNPTFQGVSTADRLIFDWE